jgi:hypothetical protein
LKKDLLECYKKGKATIERWYPRHYEQQHRELINKPCPIVLGINEHFFSKKEGFVPTFYDLKKHKIYDVVKRRSEVIFLDNHNHVISFLTKTGKQMNYFWILKGSTSSEISSAIKFAIFIP